MKSQFILKRFLQPASSAIPGYLFPVTRSRTRQLLAGLGIILGLSALLVLLWLGRGLPGWPGELFRMITGLLTTPIFMEVSFLFLGLLIVLAINHWRRRRDGDECVEIDLDHR